MATGRLGGVLTRNRERWGVPEKISAEALKEVLGDLESYLSDRVAPALVAPSVGTLLRCPAEITAKLVHHWASFKVRTSGGETTLGGHLFEAVKKLLRLTDLGLVERERMLSHLAAVNQLLLARCPPDQRAQLEADLEEIQQEEITLTPVELAGSVEASMAEAPEEEPTGNLELGPRFRSFDLLLRRFKSNPHLLDSQRSKPAGGCRDYPALLVTAAVQAAADGLPLRRALARLEVAGVEAVAADDALRTICRSLPDWAIPFPVGSFQPGEGRLGAILAFFDLVGSPQEGIESFQVLVESAIEQLNQGSLGRAVTLFRIAEALVDREKVDPTSANLFRGKVHARLDSNALGNLSRREEQQDLLRETLSFFPDLRPSPLLDTLNGEPDRLRRRLLLTLLGIHGASAWAEIVDRLEYSLEQGQRPTAWYYQRNLLFLLHQLDVTLSREEQDRELAAVLPFAGLDHHPRLVQEAVSRLAQVPDERAERALIDLLREVEGALMDDGPEPPCPRDELDRTLGALASALVRCGTARAWRVLLEHGLKEEELLGDASSRLAELRSVDLSSEPAVQRLVLRALEDRLPRKMLGLVMHKTRHTSVLNLIEAMGGTPSPEAREMLTGIASRFAGHPFGEAATRVSSVLDDLERSGAQAYAVEGETELAAVPWLLRTSADRQETGLLTLSDAQGKVRGTFALVRGELRGCRAGKLAGRMAFLQLFEQPFTGDFRLSRRSPAADELDERPPSSQLLALALQRCDELTLARIMVPDGVTLSPTGRRPTVRPGEKSGTLIRELWNRARKGMGPRRCEASFLTDAYRVRTLLAHWVAEGSLRLRSQGGRRDPGSGSTPTSTTSVGADG